MHFSSLAALAVLAGMATAKTCVNMTVPVSISARQAVFDIAIPQTNLEVTDFVLNITQQGRNFTNLTLTGYQTTVGTYNISAMFCKPSNDISTNSIVQVLTHGIGFDKSYWDYPYENYDYSYIDVATDQYKYSTLSYDRLGVGKSSHGEPLNEIQSYLEIAALYELTQMLRNGTYPGVDHAFKKVVHVGHSFGSAQTYALANLYPTATDGIVLTGFSMDSAYLGLFPAGANFMLANLNQPLRFGSVSGSMVEKTLRMYAESIADYLSPIDFSSLPMGQNLPNGYITFSNAEAAKFLLFKPKYYAPGILEYAESTKQAVTLGEVLTLGSLTATNNFAGPVMVLTGDSDLPYCGGDCLSTGDPNLKSIPAAMANNFPHVKTGDFVAYIQPNMGHAINLHYNASGAYNVIQNFLGSKGLQSS